MLGVLSAIAQLDVVTTFHGCSSQEIPDVNCGIVMEECLATALLSDGGLCPSRNEQPWEDAEWCPVCLRVNRPIRTPDGM